MALATLSLFLLASLATVPHNALAQSPGSFVDGGQTLISAMMLFLGNDEKVYMLDKAEGNAAQINGHPAWGAVWDIATRQTTVMDVATNVFCASGMHLPNGSYVTFGGNGAVGRGGNIGSQVNPGGGSGAWDSEYQDFDGAKSIRVLNPCSNSDDFSSSNCQWFDDPAVLSMQHKRWYSAAEALPDGRVVMIGGFVNGGYINRNTPNTDPENQGGAADSTFEFYPPDGQTPQTLQFLVATSGLNAYAHSFLMPSGKIFLQANVSTTLWDYTNNVETDLPPMPNGVVRVYPASGATAMLPLTPENNYTPTMIFCGGSDMPDDAWGNYSFPAINTWTYPASKDCQRITPEPTDGSSPVYVQDDDMFEGRTMGQFISLPDGTMLVVNGGQFGTAGYSTATGQTSDASQMPFGQSLAAGPVGTPAIYDPSAIAGQRWSRPASFQNSSIARLYHSSAMLLPDASVLIAGSNPNVDVNTSTVFPTEYRAEIFYPPYFGAAVRPVVNTTSTPIPKTLSYGGDYFNLTVQGSSYSGSANDAGNAAKVVLVRGGFTTHAMNMGQRHMQLNSTFEVVKGTGDLVLRVAQPHPDPHVFQPGPALLFVVVKGVPSNGTMLIVGNGQIGQQPVGAASVLPPSVLVDGVVGGGAASGSGASNSNTTAGSDGEGTKGASTGKIVGAVVGTMAVLAVAGGVIGVCMARKRRREATAARAARVGRVVPLGGGGGGAYGAEEDGGGALAAGAGLGGGAAGGGAYMMSSSNSTQELPPPGMYSLAGGGPMESRGSEERWGSTASLHTPHAGSGSPYRDEYRDLQQQQQGGFDPYHQQQGYGGR